MGRRGGGTCPAQQTKKSHAAVGAQRAASTGAAHATPCHSMPRHATACHATVVPALGDASGFLSDGRDGASESSESLWCGVHVYRRVYVYRGTHARARTPSTSYGQRPAFACSSPASPPCRGTHPHPAALRNLPCPPQRVVARTAGVGLGWRVGEAHQSVPAMGKGSGGGLASASPGPLSGGLCHANG